MKRLLCTMFLLGSIGFVSLVQAGSIASDITRRYLPTVVTVIALDKDDQPMSLGSGFFLNEQGRFVTNYHVLEGSAKAIVKSKDGRLAEVTRITHADSALDLLVAETGLDNTSVAPLGDSDLVTIGEDVVAIGNPNGLEGTVSTGIVSGIRQWDGVKFIQITAPISPGSSGGPVFNEKGKVIGISTMYISEGQSLNFAMPVNYIETLPPYTGTILSLPSSVKKKREGVSSSAIEMRNLFCEPGSYCHCFRYTIANKSKYMVEDIKIFVVFRNEQDQVVDYRAERIRVPILPALAKTYELCDLPDEISHIMHRRWEENITSAKSLMDLIDHSDIIEFRILDYEIDQTSATAPLDALFKD